MFDKVQAKQVRMEFWTQFGKYMRIHESTRGPKQKWLNYRTGIKHIFFRWEADSKYCRVAIDIQHRDEGIRELFFEQFLELRKLLESMTDLKWDWMPVFQSETGMNIARIQVSKSGWSVYDKEDWPQIWAWLEPILIGLDEVWGNAIDTFKELSG